VTVRAVYSSGDCETKVYEQWLNGNKVNKVTYPACITAVINAVITHSWRVDV